MVDSPSKSEWKKEEDLAKERLQTMLTYYPRLIEDLHEWQKRQWHIVYYVFLLIGALFALGKGYDIDWLPLQVFGSIAAFLGIVAVLILQGACHRSRRNIAITRETYRSVFDPLKPGRGYDKFWYGWEAPLMLCSAMLIACAALWVLPSNG